MTAKLRAEIPELESIFIWRSLPDKLVFELRERKPVANLGTQYYIDDDGIVLDKTSCYGSALFVLPALSCNPSLARGSDDSSPFKRGETLSSSAIRTALTFIRLAQNDYWDIDLSVISIFRDSIQRYLYYKGDPRRFTVILPAQLSEKQLRDDIFGRLIPKLDEACRNNEAERSLDLRQ